MKAFLLNILIFTICAVAVFEILTACGPTPNPQDQEQINTENVSTVASWGMGFTVYRVIDKEAQVVCWLYSGNGIDCLPIEETKLSKE